MDRFEAWLDDHVGSVGDWIGAHFLTSFLLLVVVILVVVAVSNL